MRRFSFSKITWFWKNQVEIAVKLPKSRSFDPALLWHVSPLGWEHINLTGGQHDYK